MRVGKKAEAATHSSSINWTLISSGQSRAVV
jgi:hypothetical protein